MLQQTETVFRKRKHVQFPTIQHSVTMTTFINMCSVCSLSLIGRCLMLSVSDWLQDPEAIRPPEHREADWCLYAATANLHCHGAGSWWVELLEAQLVLYLICLCDPMRCLSGGDFLSFLRKKKDELKTKQLVRFSVDAAAGMAYLESKNCIHR